MSHRIFVPVNYCMIKYIFFCFQNPLIGTLALKGLLYEILRATHLYLVNAKEGVKFLRKIVEQCPKSIPSSSNLCSLKKTFWLVFQKGKPCIDSRETSKIFIRSQDRI